MSPSHIIKFADNNTVERLITSNDEMTYRQEMREFEVWCKDNFRRTQVSHTPLHNGGVAVETDRNGLFMVHQHLVMNEEGTTKPLLPKKRDEDWHAHDHPCLLLQVGL